MSLIKVMPLVLSVVTPFVMTSGVARAAEAPVILAQYNPQDKQDEHKQHGQQQQQQQQHGQPQQQQHGQPQQQQHGQPQQQQHGQQQQQQHGQPQQQQQQLHGQQQGQPTQHGQQQGQPSQHGQQLQNQQLQQHQAQEKLQQDHKALEHAQQQKALEEQKRAQDAAKLHADQQKIQQLQQQQHNAQHQLQQAHHEEHVLHRELSAADQRAKAARDAHAADRARLIEHQKQMAANERSQAAINERLRMQNERMRAIASQRQQSVDHHGQTLIKEPGNRTIVEANGHAFIQHDESANFRLWGGTPQTHRAQNGNMISTIVRPGGVRIEVEVDSYGRPLRRVRYMPDGRRFVLFENRAIAIGAGLALGALIIDLAPPHIDFPRDEYIVDADVASEDVIYGALQAGPVEPLDRGYSLEEVLASVSLRDRMRSISIDSINFEFGSAEVGPDQAQMLESVAAVMRDMATQNPGEVFLIEGHTDAVGSDVDNLSLSDQRAQAVAQVLSQQFGIPAENLVTQGYGKQFLLIPTDQPERRNRRVVIRRITPLLQTGSDQYSASNGGPDGPGDNGPADGGPMDGGPDGGPGDQQR